MLGWCTSKTVAEMNLKLTRELLSAASDQPQGSLQVSGFDAAHEVELLADAGYVEASLDYDAEVPSAVIKRLTDAGEKLLTVLRQTPLPG